MQKSSLTYAFQSSLGKQFSRNFKDLLFPFLRKYRPSVVAVAEQILKSILFLPPSALSSFLQMPKKDAWDFYNLLLLLFTPATLQPKTYVCKPPLRSNFASYSTHNHKTKTERTLIKIKIFELKNLYLFLTPPTHLCHQNTNPFLPTPTCIVSPPLPLLIPPTAKPTQLTEKEKRNGRRRKRKKWVFVERRILLFCPSFWTVGGVQIST